MNQTIPLRLADFENNLTMRRKRSQSIFQQRSDSLSSRNLDA